MYKNYTKKKCAPPGRIQKFLLVMKITTFLLFVAFMQVSAAGLAQKITLVQKDASIREIFTEINKQTNYNIFWSETQLNGDQKLNVNFQDASLQEVLDKCLEHTKLAYSIENNTIVIKEKQEQGLLNKIASAILQSADLSGTVTDSLGTPLIGATVSLITSDGKGKYPAVTDKDGQFQLEHIPDGHYQLNITYIGYKPINQPITLNGKPINLNLMMHAQKGELKEVVVNTGYQTIAAERSTGSFEVIDQKTLQQTVSPNFLDHLDGVANGLFINKTTTSEARPGFGYGSFSIRGISTINSNNRPLIVIDNFVYNGVSSGNFDPLANINPDDVESVTLLKDAAAASIYGTQSGNGVLVITTKHGKYNQKPSISFGASYTMSGKPDLFALPQMSTGDYISVEEYLFKQGKYNFYNQYPSFFASQPLSPIINDLFAVYNGQISQAQFNSQIATFSNIDVRSEYLKYFYHNPLNQNYNLGVSGGTDKDKYYISGSYSDWQGAVKGYSNARYSFNMSNTYMPVKNLEFSIGINYTQNNLIQDGYGEYGGSSFYPYEQLADAQGNPLAINYGYTQSFLKAATAAGYGDWSYRPLQEQQLVNNTANAQEIRINPSLSYKILPGLSATASYGYDHVLTTKRQFQSDSTYNVRDLINKFVQVNPDGSFSYPVPQGGIMQLTNGEATTQNLRGQLSYNHDFGNDNSFSAIAGYDHSEIRTSGYATGFYGYDPDLGTYSSQLDYLTNYSQYGNLPISRRTGAVQTLDSYSVSTFQALISYFANAAYNYKGRYTLSASARIDETNLFGTTTNNKKKPLWSLGGSWAIDKEDFYNLSWLPALKIRATYGHQGNQNAGISAITTINYDNSYYFPGGPTLAEISNAPNPSLRWEDVEQVNLGLDFGLKNNVLTGSIEYYYKSATDLIGPALLNSTTGFTNYNGNTSDMTGQGVDLKLNSNNLGGALKWQTSFIFNYNTDKVTKYYIPSQTGFYIITGQPILGRPLNGIYSLKWAGLDPQTGDPRGYLNGKISEDYTDIYNNATQKDLVYNGPSIPPYWGSIGNSFSYNGLSLHFNIQYAFGFYFRQQSINYNTLYGSNMVNNGIGFNDFDLRWQKPGDEMHTHVPSMPTLATLSGEPGRDDFYANSSVLVQKGDNISLQNLDLGYDITKRVWPGMPFNDMHVGATYNLYMLLWKANNVGIDPNFQYSYKPPKTISLSINCSF